MQVRMIQSGGISDREVSAWTDLASHALEPNPFFEAGYILALANPNYGGAMTLLTVWSGNDMVALLPLYRRRLPLRGLGLSLWCAPNVLGIPLVNAGVSVAPVLTAAVDFLSSRSRLPSVLTIPRAPLDGRLSDALDDAKPDWTPHWRTAQGVRCPMLKRREVDNYLDTTMHGSRRQNLGNQRRRLERQLGPLQLVTHVQYHESVERFLVLEQAGWKGRANTAMLCQGSTANWFRQVCNAYGSQGRLRLVSLMAGSTTIAMKCDVSAGTGLFNLKTTFDERFARFSPGVMLEIEAVTAFHNETGYAFMDAASNYPKNPLVWLYPDGRSVADQILHLGGSIAQWVSAGKLMVRRKRPLF